MRIVALVFGNIIGWSSVAFFASMDLRGAIVPSVALIIANGIALASLRGARRDARQSQ